MEIIKQLPEWFSQRTRLRTGSQWVSCGEQLWRCAVGSFVQGLWGTMGSCQSAFDAHQLWQEAIDPSCPYRTPKKVAMRKIC